MSVACECNGWSTKCRFNEEQYMRTRRGGECLKCEGNRDGPHCEVCKVSEAGVFMNVGC